MKLAKIKKIKTIEYGEEVYDIELNKKKLFFARSNHDAQFICVHNCDLQQGAREKIRQYLEERYGKDAVLGVVTFHIFKAKSALQDASRGLGKDTSFQSVLMREISKLSLGKGFIEELKENKEMQEIVLLKANQMVSNNHNTDDLVTERSYRSEHNTDWDILVEEGELDIDKAQNLPLFFAAISLDSKTTPTVLEWIEENHDTIKWAQKLLGQVKNLGTHAGGILITPGPVYNYIPVARGAGEIVTGFKEADGSSKDLSDLGLLKLDILGLKTLNIIQGCINDIKHDLNKDLTQDIEHIDLENSKLYETINNGNVYGVFQLSDGAQELIKIIQPDCFNDIISINALNRPGPKETFGPLYGKWKQYFKSGISEKCKEDEAYPRLDFMQEITKSTYNCLLFQEQFMLMVSKAGDFNLGEADNFRRMIAWRKDNPKYYLVEKYFKQLEERMLAKNYSVEDVEYFVEYCRNFLGYSFNAAHSAGYSHISMHTVFLKTYYPAYFFANHLNYESRENYQTAIADAIANGIEILPPSIIKSKYKFTVEDGKVRIGLMAIKGLGDTAYEELERLKVGEYKTIDEILLLPFKKVTSKVMEVLLDAGAFDEFNISREKVLKARELYKEKKIITWFTRKRGALSVETMPEVLYDFPEPVVFNIINEIKDVEDPWRHFVTKLIPYIRAQETPQNIKDQKAEEVLNISLSFASKINKLTSYAKQFPGLKLQSITSRQNDTDLCYWFLVEKRTAKTKHGKSYLVLTISDQSTTVQTRLWRMRDLNKGKAYVSQLKKDQYGYTVIDNEALQELDFEE